MVFMGVYFRIIKSIIESARGQLLWLLVICAILSSPLKAQEVPEGKMLKGMVVNQSDTTGIPNVHIINLQNGRGTSSDAIGSFLMPVKSGDQILFTALGYHNDTLMVDNELYNDNHLALVALENKSYDLPVVEIRPYATFTDFKYAFLNFKDEDTAIELNMPKITYMPDPGEGVGIRIDGPITALYDQFSKRGKELRKYKEVLEKEELHRKASRVVNVETIRRYTDLKEEAEIYKFLRFCNISDEFIVENNQYEVFQQLLACYRQYCEIEQ